MRGTTVTTGMPRHPLLFTGLLLATLVASPARASDKVRLVALPVNSGEKLKSIADSIGEQMLTEMGKFERLEVMGASDVSSLLGLERQKAMMGCGDGSASCLAEISAALGAPWMVTGTLAQSGKAMRLDLKLISAADGKVAFRGGRTFKDESEVFEVVSEIITALVKKIDLKPVTTTVATTKPVEEKKPVLTPVAPKDPPPPEVVTPVAPVEPAPRVGPWVVMGAGVVSGIAGGVLIGVGQNTYETTMMKNPSEQATGKIVADLQAANAMRVGGVIAAGVGVALAGAGVVWLVAGKPTEGASVSVLVSGSSLTVQGCF
jgi:TolB-like protein